MVRFLLVLTAVVLEAAPAAAIKCYICEGDDDSCSQSKLEGDQETYLYQCLLFDSCIWYWGKDKDGVTEVRNSCGTQSLCNAAKALCAKKRDILQDYECEVGCCFEDSCNLGSVGSPISTNYTNIIVLVMSSVLGLALLK